MQYPQCLSISSAQHTQKQTNNNNNKKEPKTPQNHTVWKERSPVHPPDQTITTEPWAGSPGRDNNQTGLWNLQAWRLYNVFGDLLPKRGSFSHRGWWRTGTGCPRRLWMPQPWRHSRPGWMWLWAAWSDGWRPCTQKGGWNYMIFEALFNSGHSMILWFYDSLILWKSKSPHDAKLFLITYLNITCFSSWPLHYSATTHPGFIFPVTFSRYW